MVKTKQPIFIFGYDLVRDSVMDEDEDSYECFAVRYYKEENHRYVELGNGYNNFPPIEAEDWNDFVKDVRKNRLNQKSLDVIARCFIRPFVGGREDRLIGAIREGKIREISITENINN